MKARLTVLALAVLLLASSGVQAAPKRLVLLFTGDNRGEIAPCGCKKEPLGGLAKRKTAVDAERARGLPTVLMDSGNALFREPGRREDPQTLQRAELVLEQMEALGTAAMAVGERDLSLGLPFLRKATKGKKLKLLSANLVDKAGKAPFASTMLIEAGGLKVGVVGVSPAGTPAGEPGLTGRPPIETALAEARKLRKARKVDVVVVLAAVTYQDAVKIALLAEDAVDFVVQSHDGRGIGIGELVGSHTAVFPAGERGRQLTRLELSVDGPGPSVDLDSAARAASQLRLVEGNLLQARERLASAKDEQTRTALMATVQELEGRMLQLEQESKVEPPKGGRAHLLSYVSLGDAVAEDAALKQRVEQIEPRGSEAPSF